MLLHQPAVREERAIKTRHRCLLLSLCSYIQLVEMYSSCSSSAKMIQKIAAEQRQRELKLEKRHKKPIQEIRRDAKFQRQQQRKQQQLDKKQKHATTGSADVDQSERAKHHSYVSTLLQEQDADLLERMHDASTHGDESRMGEIPITGGPALSSSVPSASHLPKGDRKTGESRHVSTKSETSASLMNLFRPPAVSNEASSIASDPDVPKPLPTEDDIHTSAAATPLRRRRSCSIPDEVSATKPTTTVPPRGTGGKKQSTKEGSTSFQFARKKSIFGRLLSGEITTSSTPAVTTSSPLDEDVVVNKAETATGQVPSSTADVAATGGGSKNDANGDGHISSSKSVNGVNAVDDHLLTTSPTSNKSSTTQEHQQQHQQLKKKSSIVEQKRKLIETVQFAEAVGEIPLQINQGGLRIIEDDEIEGDYSDDDDSDDDQRVSIACSDEASIMTREMSLVLPTLPSSVSEHHAVDSSAISMSSMSKIETGTGGILPPEDVVVTIDPNQPQPKPLYHQYRRRKIRPNWPFGQLDGIDDNDSSMLLDKLPENEPGEPEKVDLVGINENSLAVTKRGVARGNYAQLHRKAWLEVSDVHHRYGKNLRLYYRHWEKLGCPTNKFFDWLDSKGEAAGQSLPNLDDCPRSQLDCDTVLYITNPKITEGYALDILPSPEDGVGRIVDVDGDPVQTGSDGWIFVIRDNKMYGAPKITSVNGPIKQRFHHSSFFGGKVRNYSKNGLSFPCLPLKNTTRLSNSHFSFALPILFGLIRLLQPLELSSPIRMEI